MPGRMLAVDLLDRPLPEGGRPMNPLFASLIVPAHLEPATEMMLARLRRQPRGCSHVDRHGFLCFMHPARGLMCRDCADRHRLTHTHDEEHVCDRCGGVLDDPAGRDHRTGIGVYEEDLLVSIGRGRYAAVGIVWVIGTGWCADCAAVLEGGAR